MALAWRDVPRRTAEVLRTEGPRSLFFKVLGELGYRRLLLIERDLAAPPAGEFCRLPGAEARRIEPEDADAYLAFHTSLPREWFRERFQKGHIGVAVWHEGRIVNAGWAALHECRISYLRTRIELEPDAAYIYDVYTVPEHRGQRLTAARWKLLERLLREAGARVEIGAVSPENTSILRSSERAGFRIAGRIGYCGVGPWRRWFLRYDGKPRVRLGRRL